MKKRLLHLIRHAKSDWSIAGQSDFDRELNARGRNDAPIMAARFFQNFPGIKTFHVSAAKRTRETAELFAIGHGNKITAVHYHRGLYHASDDALMEFVQQLPSIELEVAVFTHNNGISELASRLAQKFMDMPTCAIATFELQESWQHASYHSFTLRHFDYPKLQP